MLVWYSYGLPLLTSISSYPHIRPLIIHSSPYPRSQILGILSFYPATDNVLEPALGLLTSMMLRLPDIALKAAEVITLDDSNSKPVMFD